MFRKFKLKSFASLKMVSRKVQNEFKIWRVYLQARSPPRRGISLPPTIAEHRFGGPRHTIGTCLDPLLDFCICTCIWHLYSYFSCKYKCTYLIIIMDPVLRPIGNMHTCLQPLCCPKINRTAIVSKNQEDKIDARYAIEINWRKSLVTSFQSQNQNRQSASTFFCIIMICT